MKFSEFINIIYKAKNSKFTTQQTYARAMFNSACSDFSYTDEYCKKLINGTKPFSNDVRNTITNTKTFDLIPNFFSSVINKNRLVDMFDDFGISKDEKKDFNTFIEAISNQFINYVKYGEDEIPTTVKNIYEVLLDQKGNGSIIDANEKALFASKQQFVLAIKALASIEVNEDILTLKGPFESFFHNIQKAFTVYESLCNREGKKLMIEMKDHFLDGTYKIADAYLNKIAELGSAPLELIKEIHFTIYDNYKFEDKDIEVSMRLFDDTQQDKIVDAFQKLEFYPVNEIFFTQNIRFYTENDKTNLIDEAVHICHRTELILNSIQLKLRQDYEMFKKIDVELDKAVEDFNKSTIQYVVDGTYFPLTKEIFYATSINILVGDIEGNKFDQIDKKIPISRHPIIKGIKEFDKRFVALSLWQNKLWQFSNYEDLMLELTLFCKDDTFKLIMIPVTCKARIYRLIRDVKKRVFKDGITSFILSTIMSTNYCRIDDDSSLINKTSDERIATGIDTLCCFGFDGKKFYDSFITKQDSITGKYPTFGNSSNINYLHPLVSAIHFFHFYDKNWDYENNKFKEPTEQNKKQPNS